MPTQEELRAKWNNSLSQEELRAKWDSGATDTRGGVSGVKTENSPDLATLPERLLRGAASPFIGAAQLGGNIAEKVTGEKPEWGKDVDEYNQMLQDTYPETESTDFGKYIGMAANPISWWGPSKLGKTAKGAEWLGKRALAHTVPNVGQSVMMPVDEGADYWDTQKQRALLGATLGNAVTGGTSGGKATVKALRDKATKMNIGSMWQSWKDTPEQAAGKHLVKNVFREDTPEVIKLLDETKPLIRGEKPTIEATSTMMDGKYPQLSNTAGMGRANDFGSNTPGQFNIRDAENKQAVLDELRTLTSGGERTVDPITKTVNKQDSPYMNARDEITKPLYKTADNDMVYIPNDLSRAVDGPLTKAASREGGDVTEQAIRNQRNNPSRVAPRPSRPQTTDWIRESTNIPADQSSLNLPEYLHKPLQTNLPMDSGATITNKLKELDGLISKETDTYRKNVLLNTRRDLANRYERAVPEYGQAVKAHADMSIPQNRADVFSEVEKSYNKIAGPDEVAALNLMNDPVRLGKQANLPQDLDTLQQVLRSTKQGEQIARNVDNIPFTNTQPGPVNQGTQTISGQANMSDKVDALRGTLQRNVDAKRVYDPNSVQEGYKSIAGIAAEKVPPIIDPKLTAAKKLAQMLGLDQETKVNKVLAEKALDPKGYADLMRNIDLGDFTPKEKSAIRLKINAIVKKVSESPAGNIPMSVARMGTAENIEE